MDDYKNHPEAPQASDRFLSAKAIAAMLRTSPQALFAWLHVGRALGIRFELLPLLPIAYAELASEDAQAVRHESARERLVLTPWGVMPVEIDNPDEHVRLDRHWEAVALALLTQNDRALRRFRLLTVNGTPLASTLEHLRAWADAASDPEAS